MITKSTIVTDRAQPGGSRKITESHERDDGPAIIVNYMTSADADVDKRMADRVPELEAQLVVEQQAATDRALFESAEKKADLYMHEKPDAEVKTDTGMTDEELAKWREAEAGGVIV